MKVVIFSILSLVFLFSCTTYDKSKKLNIKNAELVHSKFNNINSNLSYEEYKTLIIEYGINSKFPDINK
tara:strand:- start:182 stop:388 length:207 start_codon:yes stop_codon:yes gene_type:complete